MDRKFVRFYTKFGEKEIEIWFGTLVLAPNFIIKSFYVFIGIKVLFIVIFFRGLGVQLRHT